ncbi:MAG TPA: electron transfer flavoprotein subunit alpha/FixB family protein [Gemmatimonadales bacterium]|nr:electron transfer flavoprotein subunit alpha/FixB family protein [Gemmatimonadales bacterium]
MPADILAVTETRDGVLRQVSREVVGAARQLSAAMGGGTVTALVFGSAPVEGAASLGASGADRVLMATHAGFGEYNPDGFAATVASVARDYAAVLFAATATGKDLAPRVAARLGVGCATDVVALGAEGGAVVATRPVYAGKVLERVKLTGVPAVASVRTNTFEASAPSTARPPDRPTAVEALQVPEFTQRVTVTGVKAPEKAALDVAEAPIVVSGGRGLKEPANFALLEALAEALGNTAVGASRAVVDAGWREHGAQVGQTGKTVSPGLYIAVGISGAIQHLAGMRTAKTIVAINRDKDAPIFKVADYGIVGDLFEVVPRLTEEVKKVRAQG